MCLVSSNSQGQGRFTHLCVPSRKEKTRGASHTPQVAHRKGQAQKERAQTSAALFQDSARPNPTSYTKSTFRKYFLGSRLQEKKEPFFLWHSLATYGTALNRGFMREGPDTTATAVPLTTNDNKQTLGFRCPGSGGTLHNYELPLLSNIQ